MGKLGTLAALAAAACVLVAALILAGRGSEEPSTRRLLPGFEPGAAVAISIERRGEPAIVLERGEEGTFSLVEPRVGPADPDAASELLGALEMLAYQRRGDPGRGLESPPRAQLRVLAHDGREWELSVGETIEASDQVWLGRGEDAFIADGHAVRAAMPSAKQLRERRPFRHIAAASALALDSDGQALHIELSSPPRIALQGGTARADPGAVGALVRELRELEFRLDEKLAHGFESAEWIPRSLRIRATAESGEKAFVVATGGCAGGDLAVSTHLGDGCVDRARAETLTRLAADPQALVDHHLVRDPAGAIDWLAIWTPDRDLELRWEGDRVVGPGGAEVEHAEVRRFLRELSSAAEGARTISAAADRLGRIAIARDGAPDDSVAIYRDGDGHFAVRDDEPVAFSLSGQSAARLVRADLLGFRSRALIQRDAHAIGELSRHQGGREIERVSRGELVGDYALAHPGRANVRPDAIARAGEVIAQLRAESFDADAPAPHHGLSPPRLVIEIEFDPPPRKGAGAKRRRIAVGADTSGGCYVQVDDGPIAIISAQTCEALRDPWTTGN